MKKIQFVIGMLTAAMLIVAGCAPEREANADSPSTTDSKASKVGTISVDQLNQAMAGGQCTVLDANSPQTRSALGKIPGATLLSHYKSYKASELPSAKDKKLVFYCANEQCGASHVAAEQAILAGYKDVSVLPAGIAGWRKAGKSTETVQ